MGPITYRIQLDATKDGVQKILRGFFTGDVMSRRIAISILNGSVPLTMGENTAAIMYVAKPNGVTNYNACTIEGNTIYYDVLQADVDANGITEMQVKVMDGERVLYAPFFAVEVQTEKNSDTEAVATPTFTALEEALAKAEVVYNTRLESIDIAEDLTFTATYADGSSYVSEAIKEAIGDAVLTVNESVKRLGEIEKHETERVNAENKRAEAEKQRAEEFTIMKDDVQEVLDEAEELLLKGGISEDKAQEMIDEAVKNKVDKEDGKGLSANDYSNAEKQQVSANKTNIDNIINGTTTVGNANKLGGKGASEYRQKTQTQISTLPTPTEECDYMVVSTDGTFPVNYGLLEIRYGASIAEYTALYKTIAGVFFNFYTQGKWQGWSDNFATTADLANYLPKSGGEITGDDIIPLILKCSNDGDVSVLGFSTGSGMKGYLGFNGVNTPVFYNAQGGHDFLLHTGNVGDYAIKKNDIGGQTISAPSYTPFNIQNTYPSSTGVMMGFSLNGTAQGGFGFEQGYAMVQEKGAVQFLYHTGNSNAVKIQETAPSDTSALWVW